MVFQLKKPRSLRKQLGEAQTLLLEVIVDPPKDPWYEQMARTARRAIIAVVGFTVVLIGIALIVLPGPAFVVIPLGFVILATEFVWARRVLRRVRAEAQRQGIDFSSVRKKD